MKAAGRLLLALAAAAGLAACATVEGYRQQTSLWLGAFADTLLLERGAPVQRERLSDGRELWVYFVEQHHHTDGYTTSVPRTRTVSRRRPDGEVVQITQTYYETRYEPPSDWWTQCETRFVIGLDGRIQDFRFVGNGCVAEEIY
jgi:hypothetical protein